MVLVDTNVLIDVLQEDPRWVTWSQSQLDAASMTDSLAINPIIHSELSMAFAKIEDLDAVIADAQVRIAQIPNEALFLAGKAFLNYRRSLGTKQSTLPDFYIGAHAAVMQWPILTRDARRYRTYYPTVQLITPDIRSGH
jgi:predicted nucleic acid-binding protein